MRGGVADHDDHPHRLPRPRDRLLAVGKPDRLVDPLGRVVAAGRLDAAELLLEGLLVRRERDPEARGVVVGDEADAHARRHRPEPLDEPEDVRLRGLDHLAHAPGRVEADHQLEPLAVDAVEVVVAVHPERRHRLRLARRE